MVGPPPLPCDWRIVCGWLASDEHPDTKPPFAVGSRYSVFGQHGATQAELISGNLERLKNELRDISGSFSRHLTGQLTSKLTLLQAARLS